MDFDVLVDTKRFPWLTKLVYLILKTRPPETYNVIEYENQPMDEKFPYFKSVDGVPIVLDRIQLKIYKGEDALNHLLSFADRPDQTIADFLMRQQQEFQSKEELPRSLLELQHFSILQHVSPPPKSSLREPPIDPREIELMTREPHPFPSKKKLH